MSEGRKKHFNKLTAQQVKEIKIALLRPYWGQGKKLAHEYGVSRGYISQIKSGALHGDVIVEDSGQ